MELTVIQSSVTLFEILCVIIVFASIFMRSRFFNEIYEHHPAWTTQVLLMVFFGILSIFGTISGLSIYGAVVNVRDLGPMAAGLVCGPYVGTGAGIIGGIFRFYQGGQYMWTGLSAPILSGVLGGIIYLANRRQFVSTGLAVVLIALSETLVSCYTLVLVTKPSEFFTVVTTVAIPMIAFNILGMFIFASVVHQILEEKIARKEMQSLQLEVASKRNFFTIINTIAYPVYVLDRDHRFTLVNDSLCRFVGHVREEIIGRTPRDFFSGDDSAFHWEMIEDVFNTNASREDEVIITKPDGHKCTLISTAAMYTDASDQMIIVGVFQDITERKRMEGSLKRANKKLSLLTSITRHDISNQLSVLLGYLDMLKEKVPDPTFINYFEVLTTATKRISAMIQFTKEYDMIGVNTPAWQDCHTLVDGAAMQNTLGQILMKNDLPTGTEVYADPLIGRVFFNLIDNALRYGGKLTTIRFSLHEQGDDLILVCEDDGDGIAAVEKEQIFDRGFGKNTGLGLALSREILDITGIKILENGEPGNGARFEMKVPKGMWRAVRGDKHVN
jgi:PAS domain S-box-containing protein